MLQTFILNGMKTPFKQTKITKLKLYQSHTWIYVIKIRTTNIRLQINKAPTPSTELITHHFRPLFFVLISPFLHVTLSVREMPFLPWAEFLFAVYFFSGKKNFLEQSRKEVFIMFFRLTNYFVKKKYKTRITYLVLVYIALKPKVLGNRCSDKHAFWPFLDFGFNAASKLRHSVFTGRWFLVQL